MKETKELVQAFLTIYESQAIIRKNGFGMDDFVTMAAAGPVVIKGIAGVDKVGEELANMDADAEKELHDAIAAFELADDEELEEVVELLTNWLFETAGVGTKVMNFFQRKHAQ